MLQSRRTWGIWLAYIPVAIILFVLLLKDFTFYAQFPSAYLLLLILAVVVGLNPIRHQYTYYSFIGGISLVAYVISGLLPEILLTSIATIALILKSDMKWDQHYIYPFYLSMITAVSVLSAGSYQLTRNLFVNNQFAGYQIIPIAVYMLVHFLSTHALSTIGSKYYLKEQSHFFDEHFRFFLFLGIVMVPFIFAMLYMNLGLGTPGLFIISIPYVLVAIGFKYYFRMYNHRKILLEVNKYSQVLSNSTKVQGVIDTFVQKLAKLFPVGQIAFGERNDTGDVVVKKIYEKNQEPRASKKQIVIRKNSPVVKAIRTKEMMVCLKAEDWQIEPIYEGNYHPESIVVLPISIMAEEKGVLMLTHPHQGVYDEFFISLIKVFYMYVQIILNNAYNFETLAKWN